VREYHLGERIMVTEPVGPGGAPGIPMANGGVWAHIKSHMLVYRAALGNRLGPNKDGAGVQRIGLPPSGMREGLDRQIDVDLYPPDQLEPTEYARDVVCT
jgi:hypothetical protein